MRKWLPLGAGLVVVILWASAFPAIRVASPQLGPVGLSVARLAVASVALLCAGTVVRIGLPPRRDLGWVLAAGFFGMTAYQLLLNGAELAVPAGTASIVVAAAPLVSVVTARLLFSERVTGWTAVGGGVAFAGVVLVSAARSGVGVTRAVWLAVGAMLVQGIYHPLQRPLLRRHGSLAVATWTMVAGTVMSLPLLPLGWSHLTSAGLGAWTGAVYLGLLPSAVGFALWAYAVGRMPIAVSTSLLYLVPPVAVLLAWALLGEVPVPAELLGGAVVLVGVSAVSHGSRRAARRQLQPVAAPAGTRRQAQDAVQRDGPS